MLNSFSEPRPCCSRKRQKSLKNAFKNQSANELLNVNSYMENIQSEPPLLKDEAEENANQTLELPKQQELSNLKHQNEFEKMKMKADQRDQIIKKLKENNRMITYQVQLIWQKLKQEPEKVKSRRTLIESSSNSETLEKQLKNAYHLIKIIQKEISRLRKKEKVSKQTISKMKSLKQDLEQRNVLSVNLKNELASTLKQTKQLQKKISIKESRHNNHELQTLTKELNHLCQVVTQTEKREEDKLRSIKKQYQQVKKMERDLVQKGFSSIELDQIKKRCIFEVSPMKNRDNSANKQKNIKQSKQKPEQRTRKLLNQIIYEIKIFQKKQTQFQQQYVHIDNERKLYNMKNNKIRNELNQLQIDIADLEQLSEKLRTKRILRNRKRQRLKSLQLKKVEEQKQLELKSKRQQYVQSYEKRRKRYKSLPTSGLKAETQKEKQQQAQVKVCELKQENKEELTTQHTVVKKKMHKYGIGSQGSNKFNDKYIIGKEHLGKKVTQLTLYFEPNSQFICGLCVGYQNGLKGGDYVWRTQIHQEYYKIQYYQCAQGFIRDIYCEFKLIKDKSRLVGVQIQLNDGIQKHFGKVDNFESKLGDTEYVSCIFGAMSVFERDGKMISSIQEVGMEIYQ